MRQKMRSSKEAQLKQLPEQTKIFLFAGFFCSFSRFSSAFVAQLLLVPLHISPIVVPHFYHSFTVRWRWRRAQHTETCDRFLTSLFVVLLAFDFFFFLFSLNYQRFCTLIVIWYVVCTAKRNAKSRSSFFEIFVSSLIIWPDLS